MGKHDSTGEPRNKFLARGQMLHGRLATVRISPGCQLLTGYDTNAFINNQFLWQSLIPADELPTVLQVAAAAIAGEATESIEHRITCRSGETRWIRNTAIPSYAETAAEGCFEFLIEDITRHKETDWIQHRLNTLTQPPSKIENILFEDLFDLEKIQQLQDEFARATGVATIITRPDGTPITRPGNFTRLCSDIIRKTKKGCENCYKSDAAIGCLCVHGPIIRPCLSGGLWDAGAGITVGGKHIANWLIGQVRDETQTEEMMRRYAREIGADEEETVAAFREVPSMKQEQFRSIAQMLFTLANQISTMAYQNLLQARFIAERKQADIIIQNERKRLQFIIDGANLGTWEWNMQTNETIFNEAWAQMLGYTLEELSPCNLDTWIKLTNPEDLKISMELLSKCSQNLAPSYECELRMRHKDGSWLWILDQGRIMTRDAEGKPLLMFGTHTNINRLKQTELALRANEERMDLAMNAANDGLWDWTIAEQKMFFDSRYFTLAGYHPFEFLPNLEEWQKRIHPDDLKSFQQAWDDHLSDKTAYIDTEYRFLRKDNSWMWIRCRGKCVKRDKNGTPERVVGTHADITERKRAEEEREKLQTQLHQAQKMDSIGRLAGGVAHDFNNMLGAILGCTEMALSESSKESKIASYLLEIKKAAERSAELTKQLLTFARKQTIAPKNIDLNQAVESTLKMLKRMIGENIKLVWLQGKKIGMVRIDPSQIDQILANLCVNSRDAIRDTGKITIETGVANFDKEYCRTHSDFIPGSYAMLSVSDDGCGMDQATVSQLFEPFFTTKEIGKGTGLGLATIYGIIKQNKGFVNVYSEPEHGTTFQIYLPRIEETETKQPWKTTEKPFQYGNETILLVEDENILLEITKEMLIRLGYVILFSPSAGEAIKIAKEHATEIKLLITDVVMPEMNGSELVKILSQNNPELKTLFISGYTANVIAGHGILDEGVNFLHKPFSIKDLAEKIREILDKK